MEINMSKKQDGGVNISRSKVHVKGDIVGRDKVVTHSTQTDFVQTIVLWKEEMDRAVDQTSLPTEEKDDLKKQVDVIQAALVEGADKNPTRLEKLINTLAVMSPDIFDVALATLANPLAGIGLTLRKISDKAKIEKQVP
jgi:hypothetical protein